MTSFAPALQRIAALLLLGLLIAGSWILLFAPALEKWVNDSAVLRELQSNLMTKLQTESRIPQLEAQYTALKNNPLQKSVIMEAPSEAAATNSLQTLLRTIIAASKSEISSLENLPAGQSGPLGRVAVRAIFQGDEAALDMILQKLEKAQPALYVDHLILNANTTSTQGDLSHHLSATLDVYCYWRAP